MQPRDLLRVERLAAFGVGLWSFFALEGPLWLLAVLALAPDLSMLGYLAGPRIGSRCYNAVHTYTVPIALGGFGIVADVPLAVPAAAVWVVHIGADRLLGYGLKFESGFRDTHLSHQPAPLAALTEQE